MSDSAAVSRSSISAASAKSPGVNVAAQTRGIPIADCGIRKTGKRAGMPAMAYAGVHADERAGHATNERAKRCALRLAHGQKEESACPND